MHRTRFPKLALAALLPILAALPLAQVADASPPPPTVPTEVVVPSGNKLFLVGDAVGVQIYSCDASPGGFRWNLVAPRADVRDPSGKLLMTHYGGPTWEARDGSLVRAALEGRVTVDPTAIDWFRLRVTHRAAGADGDRLGGTTFIQRISTSGGLAPSPSSCHVATVGQRAEVPYTALYAFWKASGN